ncbi:MAG: glycosyltransferase, partial [Candidatus Aminicenantes bacterium]|nr:glycosyltransferase [Candidatus Aminicenantes bacterium]
HGFSFSHFHPLWKRILFKGAEKITARFTDHFIFVSREDADTAQQLGLVKSNHSLIRSGFPLKDFLKSSGRGQAIRKKYNITKNDFVCGIIAPFKPQKGFNYLIQAASRVLKKTRNIVFFVAGDGELRPAIEKELKKRDIYQYFRLPGFIRDIPSILDIFDCGLSTALWEGLPQSIVQLRLKKIPVIASNIPGHREIIHNDQNGFLVNIGDHEGFARKIILLMSNPKKRESLGSYPDDFSDWNADHMVQKQQELYVELLKVKAKEGTNG